jgi:uncharacterized protein
MARTSTSERGWLGRLVPAFSGSQYAVYLLGCITFSVGAACFIASGLGTDPLDVFALGLRKQIHITVGLAQGGFAAFCLVVWGLWNRRVPPLSPFVTFFLCGSLIDLWMLLDFASHLGMAPYPMMSAGVVACSFGSAFILMSGIGTRAMDLVALTATQKLGIPFWVGKGVLEMALLAVGWMLGGPVGVGTLVFLVCVGWLIQPLVWLIHVCMRVPNHVEFLRRPERAETSLTSSG